MKKKPATTKKRTAVSRTRRDFTKKATYVIPAVLTLGVAPSFAAVASGPNAARPRRK